MFQSLQVQSRLIDGDFHGARYFADMYVKLVLPGTSLPLKSLRVRPVNISLASIAVPTHYWLKLFPELDELELRDCRCDWDIFHILPWESRHRMGRPSLRPQNAADRIYDLS